MAPLALDDYSKDYQAQSAEVAGFNDIRIKEKPIKEKTFKETDKKKQVIFEDVKKGI